METPGLFVDPVDGSELRPDGADLVAPSGRRYAAACGGWDLRPGAGDANHQLQAEIYNAKHGEFTDFRHAHNLGLVFQRALLDALPLSPGDRVLEIGGHRSGALAYLESRGAVGVGADIAGYWVAAQNAAAAARGRGTRWVLADAERLPFGTHRFAAVVAFDVLEHVTDLAAAVAEIHRVLAPGGTLVAHMPVADIEGSLDGAQRWWNAAAYAARQASAGHFHERLPTRGAMAELLSRAGFDTVDRRSFNAWLQPLHDHKLLPILGAARRALAGREEAPGGEATADAPPAGASSFQRAYAAAVVPVLRVLAAPDWLWTARDIGGSCAFVARR